MTPIPSPPTSLMNFWVHRPVIGAGRIYLPRMFGASCHVGTSKSQTSALLRCWEVEVEGFFCKKTWNWWLWFVFRFKSQHYTWEIDWTRIRETYMYTHICIVKTFRLTLVPFNQVVGRLWWERAPRKHEFWITSVVTMTCHTKTCQMIKTNIWNQSWTVIQVQNDQESVELLV